MKKNINHITTDSPEGFTKVPHFVLEGIVLGQINKREAILVLLVIRLTLGCHKDWAEIIQADLSAIGIRPNHAKAVIASCLEKDLLCLNEKTKQYRLGSFSKVCTAGDIERLRKLVGKQLMSNSSQIGNDGLPEQGTDGLLNQEYSSSQNGNIKPFLEGEVIRSDYASVNVPKDNDKDNFINSNKYNVSSRNFIDPHDFRPSNGKEAAALAAWNALEPHKPDSFGVYLSFARNGLSPELFYSLATEIRDDPNVGNKGATFNKRAFEYTKRHLVRGKAANV